ncbi:10 kDa heat shock protein, mitochondrial-like [Neovison vison]|uniref:Uncharacterized protein n=1 Tax=Neovison vison TaxID=452646 RepID=A0A8C7ADU2_NEOVI|nr:10 kDa heat shock protein, mitochondrial-like [Neogale vison]
MAGQAAGNFLPLFDPVFTERSAAENITKGSITLPEKYQEVSQATVVAVRSGSSKGRVERFNQLVVKVRDQVLPKYEDSKIVLDDKDYFLFRDDDIHRKYVD